MSYWTRDRIDLNRMIESVSNPGFGGTALFVGTVRTGPDDGPVTCIEYTGYEAMVDVEFGRIIGEVERRWPTASIAAQHRLGVLPVGEASVAIAAGAPHRAEAFAACRYVIEEVKKRLPVWKKEILADGHSAWRPNRLDGNSQRHPAADAVPPG